MKKNTRQKEKMIVTVGFLTWGMSMLMRTVFGYYVDELSLSNTQVGIANATLSGIVCLSAILIGTYAERKGKIFSSLGWMLLLISMGVLLLMTAENFTMILISRIILGIGCGPIFPLLMKSIELSSLEKDYPKNAGFVSNGEACISTILGPVIVVYLMNQIGFKYTNFIFAVLIILLGAVWLIWGKQNDLSCGKRDLKSRANWRRLLKNHQLLFCLVGGSLNLVASWCIFMYVPTILKRSGYFSDLWMSGIMTVMGIFMAAWMILIPSCYSKRKNDKIIIGGCIAGAIAPTALLLSSESVISIGIFTLLGGLPSVMSLFFMAILSVECVESEESASALALINGGCELFGAAIGPMIAGWLADRTALGASMLFSALCMLFAAGVMLLYRKYK